MEMPASLSPSSSATCVVSATRWLLVVDSAAIRFCAADHRGSRGLLSNAATCPAAGSGRLDQVAVGTSCPMPSRATLGNTATRLGALERVEPTVPVTW
jgi:hypothetical protein